MGAREPAAGIRNELDSDEIRDVLRETFFSTAPVPTANDSPSDEHVVATAVVDGRSRSARARRGNAVAEKPRPDHYKVICISMYTEDLARLDAVVKELKRRGYTKANRSAVLRVAVDQLDLDRVPRGI
jgi:hypothetical protein